MLRLRPAHVSAYALRRGKDGETTDGAITIHSLSIRHLPPLEAGDHLDQATFHARYEAMPPDFRAELIGGVVFVPSPLRSEHGESHALVMGWLTNYWSATPGTRRTR